MWVGQLWLAVKNGSLRFLFENKGDTFNDRRFEMLAALTQHCCPDCVLNAFTSLMSIFNDVQGQDEPILQYWSRFNGLIIELSYYKVTIPQVLTVMLFLWVTHSHYSGLLDQFQSRFISVELATINSVVEDITYHNSFTVHERKVGAKPTVPCAAAAVASVNLDQKGKVWRTSFEWLSKTKNEVIKGRWIRALAGTGICPICHIKDKPWHVPNFCRCLRK